MVTWWIVDFLCSVTTWSCSAEKNDFESRDWNGVQTYCFVRSDSLLNDLNKLTLLVGADLCGYHFIGDREQRYV